MLNFDEDVRIIYEVSEGSSPGGVEGHESKRHRWFEPESLDDLNENSKELSDFDFTL